MWIRQKGRVLEVGFGGKAEKGSLQVLERRLCEEGVNGLEKKADLRNCFDPINTLFVDFKESLCSERQKIRMSAQSKSGFCIWLGV